jgi:hypothetical protein
MPIWPLGGLWFVRERVTDAATPGETHGRLDRARSCVTAFAEADSALADDHVVSGHDR